MSAYHARTGPPDRAANCITDGGERGVGVRTPTQRAGDDEPLDSADPIRNGGRAARKPDFFIVGAPRSGTTSMARWLGQHPEVLFSQPKEPHHFGADLHTPDFVNYFGDRTRTEYLELFSGAGPDQRIGEGSVWYLYSKSAADEIHTFNQDAKIIVMLRNPLEMMRSLHAKQVWAGNEEIPSFAAALAAEPERRMGRSIPATAWHPSGLLYTDVASYSEQVRRYIDAFGPDAVCAVMFDDLRADQAGAFDRVAQFLEIDASFRPDFKVYNRRPVPRQADGLKRNLRRLKRRVVAALPVANRVSAGRTTSRIEVIVENQALAQMTPGFVVEALAADARVLGDLIGRDLSHWFHS